MSVHFKDLKQRLYYAIENSTSNTVTVLHTNLTQELKDKVTSFLNTYMLKHNFTANAIIIHLTD